MTPEEMQRSEQLVSELSQQMTVSLWQLVCMLTPACEHPAYALQTVLDASICSLVATARTAAQNGVAPFNPDFIKARLDYVISLPVTLVPSDEINQKILGLDPAGRKH